MASRKSLEPKVAHRKAEAAAAPWAAYNTLIDAMELVGLRFASGEFVAHTPDPNTTNTEVRIASDVQFVQLLDGFEAIQRYRLRFVDGSTNDLAGVVEARIGLRYKSPILVESTVFKAAKDLFARETLQLTAWPVMREFVSNCTGRAGWPLFTLPLIRSGGSVQNPESSEPAPQEEE